MRVFESDHVFFLLIEEKLWNYRDGRTESVLFVLLIYASF